MKWLLKSFEELNKDELYGLLRLRAEVFVVEQDCPYQDVDNKDQFAQHLFAIDQEEIVVYLRLVLNKRRRTFYLIKTLS